MAFLTSMRCAAGARWRGDTYRLRPDRTRRRRPARAPLISRKRRLARLIGKTTTWRAIQYGDHLTGDGPAIFDHVCQLGLEGIVSKHMDSFYHSGPSKMWLKSKNPASAAVRRERRGLALSPRLNPASYSYRNGIRDVGEYNHAENNNRNRGPFR